MAEADPKMGDTFLVHRPTPHDSAAMQVAGSALYIDDLPEPPGLLHCAFGLATEAHAEILAIRAAAAALGRERLEDCDIWVSLEPCPMCAGAIAHARLARLYYAAPDPKGGGVAHGARVFDHPQCHHKPEVYAGIGEAEAAALLRDFFRQKRQAGPLTPP